VKSAKRADSLVAGTEIQVVRIAQNDRRPDFFGQLLRRQTLYGCLRPHRHEYRRGNLPMRGVENSGPGSGGAALGQNFEAHAFSVASPAEACQRCQRRREGGKVQFQRP
jgi:hypothetical protein